MTNPTHPLGDAGDTEPGDHGRGCQGREYTCTCGYDDKRDALVSSLRAERDEAVMKFARAALHGDDEHRAWLLSAAEAFVKGQPLPPPNGKGRAEAAESSLAAEKQRADDAETEWYGAFTDRVVAEHGTTIDILSKRLDEYWARIQASEQRVAALEGALTTAERAMNHALMTLAFPDTGAQKRAWASLVEARDAIAALRPTGEPT